MDDASLDRSLREYCADRVGEATQPIDHRDQNIADTTGLEFVHHLEPEIGTLGLLDLQAEHFLLALAGIRKRQVDRLQITPNLSYRHAVRIERQDAVVEDIEAAVACAAASSDRSKRRTAPKRKSFRPSP